MGGGHEYLSVVQRFELEKPSKVLKPTFGYLTFIANILLPSEIYNGHAYFLYFCTCADQLRSSENCGQN